MLLWLTASIRKLKVRIWRIALSAGFGAVYVVLSYVPECAILVTLFSKSMIAGIMIGIAFGYVHLRSFLKNLGAFLLMNFSIAGGLIGLQTIQLPLPVMFDDVWFTLDGQVITSIVMQKTVVLMTITILLVLLVYVMYRDMYKRQALVSYYAQVTVCIDDVRVTCQGLIDTGNQLYDPLSKSPVIIMQASLWEAHLPLAWTEELRKPDASVWSMLEGDQYFAWQHRVRMVPYRTVNRSTSFMLALKPDGVMINYQQQVIQATHVLIALDGGILHAQGDYHAIIHPDLVSMSSQTTSNH